MNVELPKSFQEDAIICPHVTSDNFAEIYDDSMRVSIEPERDGKFLFLCPVCAALVREHVFAEVIQDAVIAASNAKVSGWSVGVIDDEDGSDD